MSSSGIEAINSGPLIIRTYLDATSNNTYVLGQYERNVPPNRILLTSTGALLTPSDNIYVSSINVSTINGTPFPPIDDAFWSGSLGGEIYNDNSGDVRITNSLNCSSIIGVSSIITNTNISILNNILMGTNTGGPGATYYVRGRNIASATIWLTIGGNIIPMYLPPAGEPRNISNIVAPGFTYSTANGITLSPYDYVTFSQTVFPFLTYSFTNPDPYPVYVSFPFPTFPPFTPNFKSGSTDTYLLIGDIT
jgi:hypothetical protein